MRFQRRLGLSVNEMTIAVPRRLALGRWAFCALCPPAIA